MLVFVKFLGYMTAVFRDVFFAKFDDWFKERHGTFRGTLVDTFYNVLLSCYRLTTKRCREQHASSLRQISARVSFWMIPKLSSIVIINLIANLSFLYHKSDKPRGDSH